LRRERSSAWSIRPSRCAVYKRHDFPFDEHDYRCPDRHDTTGSKGTLMAYGIVHFFPGGTKEQYDATLAAVHPADGSLPSGQISHAAGASDGGWTIMAIHDSRESWERFRDNTLVPRLQQGVEGGFQTPPAETTVDVYKLMP
jgi:hypothetical protein